MQAKKFRNGRPYREKDTVTMRADVRVDLHRQFKGVLAQLDVTIQDWIQDRMREEIRRAGGKVPEEKQRQPAQAETRKAFIPRLSVGVSETKERIRKS